MKKHTQSSTLVSVQIVHRTDPSLFSNATVNVRPLLWPERLRNALKNLALWWLAAIAFIFVPVLHFFLVPLAFVIGLFFCFRSYRFRNHLAAIEVACPRCKSGIELKSQAFN